MQQAERCRHKLSKFRHFLTQSGTKDDLKYYVVTSMARSPSSRLQKWVVLLYFSFSALSLLPGDFSTNWDGLSPKVETRTERGFTVAPSHCCKWILPDAISDFFWWGELEILMKMAFPRQLFEYISWEYLSAQAGFFDSHKTVGSI